MDEEQRRDGGREAAERAAAEGQLGVYAVGAARRIERSLFQFATIEEVNALTLLDLVVVSDLSKAWSELGQLTNSTHHAVRSFNLTVANDRRNVRMEEACEVDSLSVLAYDGECDGYERILLPDRCDVHASAAGGSVGEGGVRCDRWTLCGIGKTCLACLFEQM